MSCVLNCLLEYWWLWNGRCADCTMEETCEGTSDLGCPSDHGLGPADFMLVCCSTIIIIEW